MRKVKQSIRELNQTHWEQICGRESKQKNPDKPKSLVYVSQMR